MPRIEIHIGEESVAAFLDGGMICKVSCEEAGLQSKCRTGKRAKIWVKKLKSVLSTDIRFDQYWVEVHLRTII